MPERVLTGSLAADVPAGAARQGRRRSPRTCWRRPAWPGRSSNSLASRACRARGRRWARRPTTSIRSASPSGRPAWRFAADAHLPRWRACRQFPSTCPDRADERLGNHHQGARPKSCWPRASPRGRPAPVRPTDVSARAGDAARDAQPGRHVLRAARWRAAGSRSSRRPRCVVVSCRDQPRLRSRAGIGGAAHRARGGGAGRARSTAGRAALELPPSRARSARLPERHRASSSSSVATTSAWYINKSHVRFARPLD